MMTLNLEARTLTDGEKVAKFSRQQLRFIEMIAAASPNFVNRLDLAKRLWAVYKPSNISDSLAGMVIYTRRKLHLAGIENIVATDRTRGVKVTEPVKIIKSVPKPPGANGVVRKYRAVSE